MTKGREFSIYEEFIASHGKFGEKGLNGTKAKKVNIKVPLLPYLPTHYLPNLAPPGALTKIQGVVLPGLT